MQKSFLVSSIVSAGTITYCKYWTHYQLIWHLQCMLHAIIENFGKGAQQPFYLQVLNLNSKYQDQRIKNLSLPPGSCQPEYTILYLHYYNRLVPQTQCTLIQQSPKYFNNINFLVHYCMLRLKWPLKKGRLIIEVLTASLSSTFNS